MFSIIIPLYNKEQTIVRTLYSVLSQTYHDFEVIIVNDGSNDNSLDNINKNILDSRIKIINQENQGVSAARNRGVEESKHDYIAFLDADDEWLPGYLEKVIEAISLFPNAGMYCTPGFHRSIITGEGVFFIENKYKNKILAIDYFLDPKKLGGQTSGVVVSRYYFNILKKKFEGSGFPVGLNLNEDWACFQSLAFISQSIYIGYTLTIRNVDVKDQLVNLSDNGFDMRLNKSPKYLNITFRNFIKSESQSKSFIRYRKHEIRSFISFFLRGGYNLSVLNEFLNNLDSDSLKMFSNFEIMLYRKSKIRLLSLAYVVATKLIWKLENNLINK